MESPNAPLAISLLGGFSATVRSCPLPRLRRRRSYSLLALLALRRDRAVERDFLAGLLWPDSTRETALSALRMCVVDIRTGLGLEADRLESTNLRTLRIDLSGGARFDVADFEGAFREGGGESLDRAIALYRGPLLEDLSDDWAVSERERLHRLFLLALDRRAALYRTTGDPAAAVPLLRRLITYEPLDEDACRNMMTALRDAGDSSAALTEYARLRDRLRRELNTDPQTRTNELYMRLRRAARNASAPLDAGVTVLPVTPKSPVPASGSSNPSAPIVLPLPLTRYIGREAERAQLAELLSDSQVRLITLTGPGGIGKTRLTIESARAARNDFPGGVWFVSLAELSAPSLIPLALSRVLRLPLENEDPLGSTIDALNIWSVGSKRILLILDNLEHLLPKTEAGSHGEAYLFSNSDNEVASLLHHLLESLPTLTCLTSSRQPVGINGEHELLLPPLALPQKTIGLPIASGSTAVSIVSAESLSRIGSVALYVDRARAVRSDFALTGRNAQAISELCRYLDGLPLAIEMAASWARTLSPQQTLERFRSQLVRLGARRRDMPDRHRSLYAVAEWSYRQLNGRLQLLFRRLGVFRSGWSLESAHKVCDVPADELQEDIAQLLERSLILSEETDSDVHESKPRYRLLEPLREFALEKLEEAGEAPLVRRRLAEYVLSVAEASRALTSVGMESWLARLDIEQNNIRAVLDWCLERGQSTDEDAIALVHVSMALAGLLCAYWGYRGLFVEGRDYFRRMADLPGARSVPLSVRGQFGAGVGTLVMRHGGDLREARSVLEDALSAARALEDRRQIGLAAHNLGECLMLEGILEPATELLYEALEQYRSIGNKLYEAGALHGLGSIELHRGNLTQSRAYLETSLEMMREVGHPRKIVALVGDLGSLAVYEGDRIRARHLLLQTLLLSREIGDPTDVNKALLNLINLEIEENAFSAAAHLLSEVVTILRHLENLSFTREALEHAFEIAHAAGRYPAAARLAGAAQRQRHITGFNAKTFTEERQATRIAHLKKTLGSMSFDILYLSGEVLTYEEALGEIEKVITGVTFSGEGADGND